MRLSRSQRLVASLVGALLALSAGTVAASGHRGAGASGGTYELQPVRIANGGRTLVGGSWSLWATVGQHDARVVESAGGAYEFEGGLHARPDGVGANPDGIFSSGFE